MSAPEVSRRDRLRFRLNRFAGVLVDRSEAWARQLYDGSSEVAPVFEVASDHCRLCGRALTDPESVERGMGRQCWETVVRAARRRWLAKRART